jgi:hypothetical protein
MNLTKFLINEEVTSFGWRNIFISVIKNSKSILTKKENEEFTNNLVDEIQVITAESFGTKMDTQSDDGVRNHVVNAQAIALLHDSTKTFGFASFNDIPEDKLLYLHGIAIANNLKGMGAGPAIVKTLTNMTKLPRIAFTTQNPIMFCLLKKICSEIYPCPENELVPQNLRVLGEKLINGRSKGLNHQTFVVNDLYEECLYDPIPDCSIKNVNQWFTKALKINNGITRNGFLFVGEKYY